MSYGTVKLWRNDRGFGFIRPDEIGNDIFVHVKDLQHCGLAGLQMGQRVEYDTMPDRRDSTKFRAIDLRIVEAA
jgi:CspA family cold shock protein